MFSKKCKLLTTLVTLVLTMVMPTYAADGASVIDTGDTAFMLISMAFVMIMTPALALFYGGMVRPKNVLNTIMQCFLAIGIVTVQWLVIGYTLAFGPDVNGIIGNFNHFMFDGIGMNPGGYSATIPSSLFALFQMMFAIITVGIITGAFAERMKFGAYALFVILWTTLVYDPVAHWIWGAGGWLSADGVMDFAGGTVIHILSGVSGLVVAVVIGRRIGYRKVPMIPHNLPLVVMGASFLWLGWFGFNGGSALGANGLAAHAMVTTQISASAAMLAWLVAEYFVSGKPTTLGAASGAVAGLVAITPAAGFVPVWTSLPIGIIGGFVCYYAVVFLKAKLGYDDSLDAFGIHGIGGIWGAIATGLFASTEVNEAGSNGLFYGNPEQLWIQLQGALYCALFAIVVTYVIIKVIGLLTPIVADRREQTTGLDFAEHGERGYAYMDSLGALNFNSKDSL